jgi:hypothetical protein
VATQLRAIFKVCARTVRVKLKKRLSFLNFTLG